MANKKSLKGVVPTQAEIAEAKCVLLPANSKDIEAQFRNLVRESLWVAGQGLQGHGGVGVVAAEDACQVERVRELSIDAGRSAVRIPTTPVCLPASPDFSDVEPGNPSGVQDEG